MARLTRSPSRTTLAQWEEVNAIIAAQLPSAGCTCSAAEQLEAERLRLVAQAQNTAYRGEQLSEREAELEQRVVTLEESEQALKLAKCGLQDRRAEIDTRILGLQEASHEADERERSAALFEEELQQRAAALCDLEQEAQALEEAVAQGELALMEERNVVEEELDQIRQQRTSFDAEAAELACEYEGVSRRLDEAERDRRVLSSDEQLLTEIEEQLEPIHRILVERERRLCDDDTEFRVREADCDEREARVAPEHRRSLEALALAEQRIGELRAREEASEAHQLRLILRQKDLGGAERHLISLEGAVQRRSGGASSDVPAAESPGSIKEARSRLMRLRSADADWAERVRVQQCGVERLEAILEHLEQREAAAGASAGYSVRGDHIKPSSGDQLAAKLGGGLAGPGNKAERLGAIARCGGAGTPGRSPA